MQPNSQPKDTLPAPLPAPRLVSGLTAIPENWTLKPYGEAMAVKGWAGSYDDQDGKCVGFLYADATAVQWINETNQVLPILISEACPA